MGTGMTKKGVYNRIVSDLHLSNEHRNFSGKLIENVFAPIPVLEDIWKKYLN